MQPACHSSFTRGSFNFPLNAAKTKFICLQLYKGDTQPKLLVEGWNTWFFDDLAELVSSKIIKTKSYKLK
jgi:hypothetical protein